jgi:thiosulfate/3-mercaptopyruvate sulfurtransferase
VTGHEAALLDGGLDAWDGELATAPAIRAAAAFTAAEWPADALASIEEVEAVSAAVASGGPVSPDGPGPALIDARPRERYLGEPDGVDPRAGHIPGARSLPCRENVDSSGRILPSGELRARFDVDDATEVISYCGSGVTACHNLLAMEQAGLGRGRLFPGSWSQWSRDPARPAETAPAGTP